MVPIDHAAVIPNGLIGNVAAEIGAPLIEIERQEKGFELVQIIAVQELKRTKTGCTLRCHSKLVQKRIPLAFLLVGVEFGNARACKVQASSGRMFEL